MKIDVCRVLNAFFEAEAELSESILGGHFLGNILDKFLDKFLDNSWYKFWDFQLQKCAMKTSEVYHDGGGWVKFDE